jgi:hypothetical protein
MAKKQHVDFFGNIIEIGDAYFYGSPPTAGKVTAINTGHIVLTYHTQVFDDDIDDWVDGQRHMKCGSPDTGVCLDKTFDKKIV